MLHADHEIVSEALTAISKEVMRQNELGLARAEAAVDFDGVGSMPERMHRVLSALSEGLRCLGLRPDMAALGVFPFVDRRSGDPRPALLFYSDQQGGADIRYGRRYVFQVDVRSQVSAPEEQVLQAFAADMNELCARIQPGRRWDLIAAPYYVRQWSNKGEFDVDQQIFSRFYHCGSLLAPTWPWLSSQTTSEPFIQRLVLLAGVPGGAHNAMAVERHAPALDSGIRCALGAFLSSAGINAEENAILFAQRVAAHSLLRAHEIANETRFLLDQQRQLQFALGPGNRPQDAADLIVSFRKRFEWLLENVNRLQGTGADAGLETLDWRQMIDLWWRDRSWEQHGPMLRHRDHVGAEMYINFDKVASDIYLSFVPAYFDRLLDILSRNVFDSWEGWDGPKVIELSAEQRNGSVVLFYRSTGEPIDPEKLPRLFREVVSSKKGRSRGTGLWAIGLAFSSHGLPYPIVHNLEDMRGTTGVQFEIVFPVARH
ncbi:MAG TPA: hypothetical protein VF601_10670 [Beijerinckiaceae bacterium]|jgi:hypothetical protein